MPQQKQDTQGKNKSEMARIGMYRQHFHYMHFTNPKTGVGTNSRPKSTHQLACKLVLISYSCDIVDKHDMHVTSILHNIMQELTI